MFERSKKKRKCLFVDMAQPRRCGDHPVLGRKEGQIFRILTCMKPALLQAEQINQRAVGRASSLNTSLTRPVGGIRRQAAALQAHARAARSQNLRLRCALDLSQQQAAVPHQLRGP